MNKELRQSFSILRKVYENQAFAGIELNKTIIRERDNVNCGLITKIVYGVIEKDTTLSYIMDSFVSKKPDATVALILKLGIYVRYYISSIPAYTCVNELVEITKSVSNKSVAGFVNATLKSVYSKDVKFPDKNENLVEYLSIKYSYPSWLVTQLLKEHDEKFVEELLATKLTTLTHIRILNEKMATEDFVRTLQANNIEYLKSALPNTLYVEYSELIKNTTLKNNYIVQGLPSIITAKNIAKDSNTILDLCASPGGKSVLIAQENKSATVISCDVSDFRVDLIKKYAESYNITNIEVVQNDATVLNNKWIESFDTVLCDVPCSNLGIASKKPDVLLNRTLDSIKELPSLQLSILETASNYVKKGGILLYSTCSIMKSENEEIIGKFLSKHKDFKIMNVDTFGVDVSIYHNLVTFYPNVSGCEGFFIGRLMKL